MPPWADLVGQERRRQAVRQGDERGEYFVHVKGGWKGAELKAGRTSEQGDKGGRKGGTPKGGKGL